MQETKDLQHVSQLINLPDRTATDANRSTPAGQNLSRQPAATECRTCRDIGWVYVETDQEIRPGVKATMTVPCPKCGRARIAKDLQSIYPLPAAFAQIHLDRITAVIGQHADGSPDRSAQRALGHARRYAANPRGWITFQGAPGNGKTMLLNGIYNAAKARSMSAAFLPARSIADLMYRAIQPDPPFSLQRIESDLRWLDLVCIDEFDKCDWSKTYVHDAVYNVLNWRYEHEACTAIAFNDEARIPDTMVSRFRDGRWSDGQDDGIFRITVEDQRPYLHSIWTGEQP